MTSLLADSTLRSNLNNRPEKLLFFIKTRPLRRCMFVTYTSSNDDVVVVPAKVDIDRLIERGDYQVNLIPLDNSFAPQKYYRLDLESLIESGRMDMYIKVA